MTARSTGAGVLALAALVGAVALTLIGVVSCWAFRRPVQLDPPARIGPPHAESAEKAGVTR